MKTIRMKTDLPRYEKQPYQSWNGQKFLFSNVAPKNRYLT
jgi:hypothetical protein